MQYTVISCAKVGEIKGDFGTLFKYILSFEGQENGAEFLQKPETAVPKAGDVLEGELTNDPRYGLKFKKSKAAGYGGGGGFKSNPETGKQIARMNALGHAIKYVELKAGFMEQKEALKYVEAKHIVEVSDYFRKYIEGEITVVTENRKETSEELARWASEETE